MVVILFCFCFRHESQTQEEVLLLVPDRAIAGPVDNERESDASDDLAALLEESNEYNSQLCDPESNESQSDSSTDNSALAEDRERRAFGLRGVWYEFDPFIPFEWIVDSDESFFSDTGVIVKLAIEPWVNADSSEDISSQNDRLVLL